MRCGSHSFGELRSSGTQIPPRPKEKLFLKKFLLGVLRWELPIFWGTVPPSLGSTVLPKINDRSSKKKEARVGDIFTHVI